MHKPLKIVLRKTVYVLKKKILMDLKTYTMSEIELSRYCREKGEYTQRILKKWRISCIDAKGVLI